MRSSDASRRSTAASSLPIWQSCAISGAAAVVAEAVTIPLDTAKVRLQTQRLEAASVPKYRGPLQTIGVIVREQGVRAPFRGLVAGTHRMCVFTGIRLGLLDTMKDLACRPDGSLPLGREAGCALVTSGVAITLANPADVVKVRYQNGSGVNYRSVLDSYRTIIREEGLLGGLWKGYTANLVRNCTISAVELTAYNKSKQLLLSSGLSDGPHVHVGCGLFAGLLATLLGSPADVVGTRIVAARESSGSLGAYCINMLRREGISSFYKGFIPNFARIGSYNIVLWASYEQFRKLLL
uniref:Uncharacterized protein n=1 Tax=Alexandrium monilatum TaxID=311494 RepID=A0A7S4V9F7_9DINO